MYGENKFERTPIFENDGYEAINISARDSASFELPKDDKISQCIKKRALNFQGHAKFLAIEPLKLQRYEQFGHYVHHYDWFDDLAMSKGNRASTFMVYVEADCKGGGTNFRHLRAPPDEQWCDVIECGENKTAGVTFKPIPGNAIFWHNLHANGSGHLDTFHAGLPVEAGTKTGLNIWSWQWLNRE
jgi:prolyl 4-hydroxylase